MRAWPRSSRGRGAEPWLWLAALSLPALVGGGPHAHLLRAAGVIGLYMLLGMGLNLTLGFAGLFDLGFAAFYGLGAYAAALASIAGWPFPLTLCASLVACVFARWLLGLTILRLRGDYLAIVTLGFGEVARHAFNNLDGLTRGPKGLPGPGETIRPIALFGLVLDGNAGVYLLILGFVAAGAFASRRLKASRLGRAWAAIKDDETAAELCGLPVKELKLAAFTLSAAYAAVAGCLFAHWEQFVTPESFVFWESLLCASIVVIGGRGSVGGVLAGALALAGTPLLLQATLAGSRWLDARYLIFGLLLAAAARLRA